MQTPSMMLMLQQSAMSLGREEYTKKVARVSTYHNGSAVFRALFISEVGYLIYFTISLKDKSLLHGFFFFF